MPSPHPLTVLLPLCPERVEALRQDLLALGNDVGGRTLGGDPDAFYIDFARTPTHFARFVLLPDPDRGVEASRLLFAAIHDGPLHRYLPTLLRATRRPDRLWDAAVGYPGEDGFTAWIEAHAVETEGYYMAFRDQSVEAALRLSRQADAFQEAQAEGRIPPHGGAVRRDPPLARTRSLLQGVARAPLVELAALRMLFRHGPLNTFRAGLEISASLDRLPLLRWINRLTGNRMAPLSTPHSEVALDGCDPCRPVSPGDEVVEPRRQRVLQRTREDRVAQNQLTLLTVNDPARVRRVAAVMGLIGFHSRNLSPPGSLVGISTIHFVRWAIIDEGRRLLMVSDYDGSWEAYIEEFAEMILSGLDAIWAGSVGYPEGGARDLQAFKRFLRCRQFQAEVFYSAYPGDTVLNFLEHRALTRERARILQEVEGKGGGP